MIQAVVHDLRRSWMQLALTDVFYKLIAFVVLTPIAAILFQIFISLSGRRVLADEDILNFFVRPLGWLCLIAVGAVSIAIIALEQAALMIIVCGAKQDKRIGVIGSLRFTAASAVPVLLLTARMSAWALPCLAPFLVAGAAVYSLLLTRYDINYYLTATPPEFYLAMALGAAIGLGMALVAIQIVTIWLFALPLLLFERRSPRDAMRLSRQQTKGNRRRIALWVAGWAAAGFFVSSLAQGAVSWIGRVAVAHSAETLALLLLTLGALLTLWALVNLAVSILSTAVFATLLVNLYAQLSPQPTLELPSMVNSSSLARRIAFQLTGRKVLAATITALILSAAVGVYVFRSVRVSDRTSITAHRGASAAAPENTLAAIRQAIADGADWVEIDVQETADGKVVVMHDSDFKKIAGSDLKIWDATLEDLKDLDIGSWHGPDFRNERVATLDQVLEMCQGRIGVNIELKSYGRGQQLEERVIEVVEHRGMEREIVVMSLNRDAVAKMKRLRPNWKVGLLTAVAFGDLTREEADFLAVNVDIATRSFIRSAHRAGIEVQVWTVNDPLVMSTMIGRGVDSLITDQPALARSVLKQREPLSSAERLLVEVAMFFKATPEYGGSIDEF